MAGIGQIPGIGGAGALSAASGLSALGGSGSAASQLGNLTAGISGDPGGLAGVGATATSGQGFVDTLGSAFNQLNTQITGADAAMADFAAGGSSDLHTVMLQMQEASIGLQVGIQVRDKLLEAYQEIMRLQL